MAISPIRRMLTTIGAAAAIAVAVARCVPFGDPYVDVWVTNSSGSDLVLATNYDFASGDASSSWWAVRVPAGSPGGDISRGGETGTLSVLLADGCRELRSFQISTGTYDLNISSSLDVSLVKGPDLSMRRDRSDIAETEHCLPIHTP